MVGEGISYAPYEAIGVNPPEGYSGNGILIDEDNNRDSNAATLEMITNLWNIAKEPLVDELNSLKTRVLVNEENIKAVSIEMKNQGVELNNKIDNLGEDLNNKITSLGEDLNNKIEKVNDKIDNLGREVSNGFNSARSDSAAILQAIQQQRLKRSER